MQESNCENSLINLYKAGLGIHQGGLDGIRRDIMEQNFRKGLINVLVGTTTVAWG